MKSFFVFLALMGVSFGVAEVRPSQPKAVQERTSGLSWNEVQAYIFSHASNVDSLALSCLEFEASIGIQTWTLTDSTPKDRALKDGPGLGWPAANVVIEFETTEEAEMAASLILEVTSGGKARQ
ncbi:MAG TPA: hypothetical protein PKA27_03510 [Fimbriimonadaceae bacterium]|nr:hypothetical protein [Fimbriimonadaceae bacterium]